MTLKMNFRDFRKVTCTDGFVVTIVDSAKLHVGIKSGQTLELITPSEVDPLIADYAEYDCPEMMKTCGNYVYIEPQVVEELLNKHGGVMWITCGKVSA